MSDGWVTLPAMLVHPTARFTRVLTPAAAETIRARDGSELSRKGPSVLSAGTRALFIELRRDGFWGDLAEIEPLDGPHEGERLLLLAEHLEL
jgi:hypothetical protein